MTYISDLYIHPNTAHGCITSNRIKCAASSAMKMNVSDGTAQNQTVAGPSLIHEKALQPHTAHSASPSR